MSKFNTKVPFISQFPRPYFNKSEPVKVEYSETEQESEEKRIWDGDVIWEDDEVVLRLDIRSGYRDDPDEFYIKTFIKTKVSDEAFELRLHDWKCEKGAYDKKLKEWEAKKALYDIQKKDENDHALEERDRAEFRRLSKKYAVDKQ